MTHPLRFALSLALCALLLAAAGAACGADASNADAAPAPAADQEGHRGPVVIELFTSQGCSSCPPADRLLTRLGSEEDRVLPLSFHVDYWNYIGWTDPFSSERWSERQRAYARTFDSHRVYTPQLVVDGRVDCVGSVEKDVRRLVREELRRPDPGRITLEVDAQQGSGTLLVTGEAWVDEEMARPLDLWVALYQEDLTTSVGRGENRNRTLHNDYVVRRLERAAEVGPEAGVRARGTVELEVDPSWDLRDLGVVGFLQDPETREIHGGQRITFEQME